MPGLASLVLTAALLAAGGVAAQAPPTRDAAPVAGGHLIPAMVRAGAAEAARQLLCRRLRERTRWRRSHGASVRAPARRGNGDPGLAPLGVARGRAGDRAAGRVGRRRRLSGGPWRPADAGRPLRAALPSVALRRAAACRSPHRAGGRRSFSTGGQPWRCGDMRCIRTGPWGP